MNKNKEAMRWTAALTLCLAALLFFLRMAVIWRDVDTQSGLFSTGESTLCSVYNAAGVILLLGFLAGALVIQGIRKKKAPLQPKPADRTDPVPEEPEEEDPLFSENYDPGALPDEQAPREDPNLVAAATWEGTLSAFSYLLPGFGFLFFALSFVLQGSLDVLTALFCAVSAVCGGYFLIAGIYNRTEKKTLLAFGGLIPAVWATLRMIIEYRDVEKYANRSMYTANLIFLVAVVCFFVYQAQITLGHAGYAMPHSWFAAALLVLLFGLSARLPQLLGLVLDRLGEMDLVDAASLLLDLALTLFAGLKIRRMLR